MKSWRSWCRGQLKCDGTRAETRIRVSAKRTSPFKSAVASLQSTTDSRAARVSGSNAGYTMFRDSWRVLVTTPFTSFPFTSHPARLCVQSHLNWSLRMAFMYGHVQRMEEGRLPKEVMKWSPPRRRKRGRPKLTWAEGIRGLMGEKGLMGKDWNERGNWRKEIK